MLSILIPIFNYDIRELVNSLAKQCSHSGIEYEIICLDDASETNFKINNAALKDLPNVRYEQLEKNIGRSSIRNKLASMATFEHLLFMDCDSAIVTDSYIENYIRLIPAYEVIYGGRRYTESPPDDKAKFLRWKYGSKREQISAERRKENPYLYFLTNNFLIKKSVFEKIRLNEELKGYGHEDTLMAFDMKKNKINILHIENPLYHVGLETADEFLNKTKEGIYNLLYIMQRYPYATEKIKLVKYYGMVNLPLIKPLLIFILNALKNKIYTNIVSASPNLFLFDLFKLSIMLTKNNKH